MTNEEYDKVKKEERKQMNEELRERSGSVDSDDKLVSFLYELMRDCIAPSGIETIVRNSQYEGTTHYTNGYLANYAKDLAARLK